MQLQRDHRLHCCVMCALCTARSICCQALVLIIHEVVVIVSLRPMSDTQQS